MGFFFPASGLRYVAVHVLIRCILLGYVLVYMLQQRAIDNYFIAYFLTRGSR